MFEGIITPIVTPFHRDTAETINYEAMENLVDHLIEKGVSGIFPLGSNGEFHVLNSEEKWLFQKRSLIMWQNEYLFILELAHVLQKKRSNYHKSGVTGSRCFICHNALFYNPI